jgi:nuclear protein localization family protein 4
MRSLNELGAPDVQPGRQDAGDGGDAHRRLELAKWLSDWHLLSFLGTCGLLSEVTDIPPLPFFGYAPCLLTPTCVHIGRCESSHSCRYFAEYGE